MTSKSYINAVLDGDPELKVVLEHNGSVFLPHATSTLAGTAGLAADVIIHHRDGRTAKVPVINLQKVSPGEGGSGFVAAFFQEAPMAVLESSPDPELAETKAKLAEMEDRMAGQFADFLQRFSAMTNDMAEAFRKIGEVTGALEQAQLKWDAAFAELKASQGAASEPAGEQDKVVKATK